MSKKINVLKFSELLWIILNFLALPFSYSPEEKSFGIGEKKAKILIKKWSDGNCLLESIYTFLFLLIPLVIVILLITLFAAIVFSISKELFPFMRKHDYNFFEAVWYFFFMPQFQYN